MNEEIVIDGMEADSEGARDYQPDLTGRLKKSMHLPEGPVEQQYLSGLLEVEDCDGKRVLAYFADPRDGGIALLEKPYGRPWALVDDGRQARQSFERELEQVMDGEIEPLYLMRAFQSMLERIRAQVPQPRDSKGVLVRIGDAVRAIDDGCRRFVVAGVTTRGVMVEAVDSDLISMDARDLEVYRDEADVIMLESLLDPSAYARRNGLANDERAAMLIDLGRRIWVLAASERATEPR
ncbi:hypothetical protein Corgl_0221 [Coriobacterium glomerans PW2]|uniref:Uncharacterized protein n=1 Tax=Coriobacterium glomerans (strain ATCC 49209 / DSM 20642 / JCM 10262 / PW2) TaxID=700015 RepID=F2N709_CORGP|nr:hypothetical protein [Coriobacterium glomerans]AEB06348.1 hypothetical protein Corgl_0221 [Coriobacterium glomerans PW2]